MRAMEKDWRLQPPKRGAVRDIVWRAIHAKLKARHLSRWPQHDETAILCCVDAVAWRVAARLHAAEQFTLANDAPKPAVFQFVATPTKQRVLLAGMDCLAGQGDLFETDGEGGAA